MSDSAHDDKQDTTQKPQGINSATPHPQAPDPPHAVEPSGYKGDSPATAGPGPTAVNSNTPENAEGRLNPSAPEDANTTPGTTSTR